jgi:hypothetical protein
MEVARLRWLRACGVDISASRRTMHLISAISPAAMRNSTCALPAIPLFLHNADPRYASPSHSHISPSCDYLLLHANTQLQSPRLQLLTSIVTDPSSTPACYQSITNTPTAQAFNSLRDLVPAQLGNSIQVLITVDFQMKVCGQPSILYLHHFTVYFDLALSTFCLATVVLSLDFGQRSMALEDLPDWEGTKSLRTMGVRGFNIACSTFGFRIDERSWLSVGDGDNKSNVGSRLMNRSMDVGLHRYYHSSIHLNHPGTRLSIVVNADIISNDSGIPDTQDLTPSAMQPV